jgi:GMP synthase (glutamine-hydrolysing)
MSANDPDDYIRIETDWIEVPLAERKPFLGICLGAQMLANHLGGRVFQHPDQHVEIGYHPLRPMPAAEAMCLWPRHVYQWHREGFEAPSTATLLAVADGPFEQQAFAYAETAVGLQFHPEITYALVQRWTGHNAHRLTQPGALPREQHLSAHFLHAPQVHRWMDAFLAHWLGLGGACRGR